MDEPPGLALLVDELLGCPATQWVAWIEAHRPQLSIAMIEELKRRTDQSLRSDSELANKASACALILAECLPEQPLALALASWARGNWASFNAPSDAIVCYRQALEKYRNTHTPLAVARLLANLVAPLAECGHFAESDEAYLEAHNILQGLGSDGAFYQLSLEQNYGWLLHSRGEYADALIVHERALELAQQFDQPDRIAEVQVNRTLTLAMLGRIAEGETALLQCRSVVEAHAQAVTVARIDMDLGELSAALGRPAEALRWLESARKGFQSNAMELGSVLMREAELLEQLGLWREAHRGYQRAEALFQRLEMWPEVGRALFRAAGAARQEGRSNQQVARLLDQAGELWQKLDQPFWQAAVIIERAHLAIAMGEFQRAADLLDSAQLQSNSPVLGMQRLLLQGEFSLQQWQLTHDTVHREEASRAFMTVLDYAEQQQHIWMQRQALAGLGRLSIGDDPATGRALLERAIAIDEHIRQALSVEELKAGFALRASDLLPLLAQSAIVWDQPLQALNDMWRAKGGALLDLLRLKTEDRKAVPELEMEIARARQHLATERWRLAREYRLESADESHLAHDSVLATLEERLIELRRRRNQLGTSLPDDKTPDLIARALADMQADLLIEYTRCDDQLLVVCTDRYGACRAATINDLDGILDLRDRLDLSLRNVVEHPQTRRAANYDLWMAEVQPTLQELYTLLIAPLGALPEHGRLLLAPCEPITMLPFAALIDAGLYLGERLELEMMPSGALMMVPLLDAQKPLGPPLVIASSAEGRLAGTAAEAKAITEALPSSICLVDDPETLAHLTQLMTAPSLLHIAAHTILRPDTPIFSALQLAGGTLTVEQCYDLPLAGTQLVTLSGCATASGLDSGGALLAFQSAFFTAGVRHVLSSLWPVDDEATAAFMTLFYHLLVQGHSPATALQRTQAELRARPGYDHPAIWAAFTCSRR